MSRSVLALAFGAGLLAVPLVPYSVTSAAAADVSAVTAGSSIYDAAGEKVGTVTDILTSTHGAAFAVVDVGSYVGKPKIVLCPLTRITFGADHMTVKMTRSDVLQMPDFGYNV
jgi:hypothetical protein